MNYLILLEINVQKRESSTAQAVNRQPRVILKGGGGMEE